MLKAGFHGEEGNRRCQHLRFPEPSRELNTLSLALRMLQPWGSRGK